MDPARDSRSNSYSPRPAKRPRPSSRGNEHEHEHEQGPPRETATATATATTTTTASPRWALSPASSVPTSLPPPITAATTPATATATASASRPASASKSTSPPKASASKPTHTHTQTAAAPSAPSAPAAKRAVQACLRCRRQKLKCVGGWPCKRCEKGKHACDFAGMPPAAPAAASAVTATATASTSTHASAHTSTAGGLLGKANEVDAQRIEVLEASVATLLAGMSGMAPRVGAHPLRGERHLSNTWDRDGDRHRPPPAPVPHVRHQQHHQQPAQVHFAPGTAHAPTPTFPPHSGSGSTASGRPPADTATGTPGTRYNGRKAEERLEAAMSPSKAGFDAPFRPLVFRPSVWDNRESTPRASPQPSESSSAGGNDVQVVVGDLVVAWGRDAVRAGVLDEPTAEVLFAFFIDNLHPFMPVVDVTGSPFPRIRAQSPALMSAILGVAGKFYVRYAAARPDAPQLSPDLPGRLAAVAEWHLAQTLLRKRHTLYDVQAALLLAAWGLQPGGRGPDAWIVTGHAARIARRLGHIRELRQLALSAPEERDAETLARAAPKWRTWLCLFVFDSFFALGFGRPQSHAEFLVDPSIDEELFLETRLAAPLPTPGAPEALQAYGDAYIAAQVQLARLGSDLVAWGDALTDPDQREPAAFRAVFRELSGRLEDWCKRWIWSSSHFLPYLGPSARIVRLQADHLRLCLNSVALKAPAEGDEDNRLVVDALAKGFQAATNTIQAHHESWQTDLALSFATDYLTITLGQAAVFLIRIGRAPGPLQQAANIDPHVVLHYLKMAVDELANSDLSETRLGTYLSRTIRDIARAAGLLQGDDEREREQERERDGNREEMGNHYQAGEYPGENELLDIPDENAFAEWDLEFLQLPLDPLDLGVLLGLSGEQDFDAAAVRPE